MKPKAEGLEKRMPVLFIGHGSPENAIQDNAITRRWKKLAKLIPRPNVILCISAHWLKEGTAITSMEKPRTLHDFYGFPKDLYEVAYKAKGSPERAYQIKQHIKSVSVGLDFEWGLDHGTWSVLMHMYPAADIPVIQLSLDYYLPFEKQIQIGRELAGLRDRGFLIIGSGNVVHNLMKGDPHTKPYGWAVEFDGFVKKSLEAGDALALINYTRHKYVALAHPTSDHFLPLLYVTGACENEPVQFFNDEILFGSLSMRCAVFGAKKFRL